MSLPSSGFAFGSAASSTNVRDVIASYRRAQFLVAESTVASSPDVTDSVEEDTDSIFEGTDSEDDVYDEESTRRPSLQQDDGLLGQMEWDGLSSSPVPHVLRSAATPYLESTPTSNQFFGPMSGSPPLDVDEESPLLRRVSFSTNHHPRHTVRPAITLDEVGHRKPVLRPVLNRAPSSGSIAQSTSASHHGISGHSTFGQTLFNSIAILLGIGMLSEPLAFSYAGWVAGTGLIIFYGFISCYTAKLLARIIMSDHRLRSYTDIGRKAFGSGSTFMISILFCLELFSVSVILVTLYADSLHEIIPLHSSDVYKVWGLLILVPTVFLPLSLLSYTSILGIISTILMVIVILVDGLSKKDAPGSLWSPGITYIGVESPKNLGLAFGLFMAGFSGHAVIPSLARDMEDPSQFEKMIDWAFVIATFIYALIGYAGYLMFGSDVSEEISMDLLKTPGYNPTLNKAALWMLVISPLSKFALTTQPLNATISILLGIDELPASQEDVAKRLTKPQGALMSKKRILGNVQRVVVTLLAVIVSVAVPDFSALMAFLGSFSAFMLCVIGPLAANIAITGRCSIFDGLILVLAVVMAVWGTVAAFLSA